MMSLSSRKTENASLISIFSDNAVRKRVPRAIFVDLEPSIIDEIRTGPYRQLYHPEQLISNSAGSSNTFTRGREAGDELIDVCLDRIRRLADHCFNIQGFIIYNAVGGGTGSGFGALLLQHISDLYGKKCKMAIPVFPSSSTCSSVVQPYNSVLSTAALREHTDTAILMDNAAIFNMCRGKLSIERPKYRDMNKLISQVVSSLTASIRFGDVFNKNMTEIQTNLVPIYNMQFMISSYSPIISPEKVYHNHLSVADITNSAFELENMMVKCDPRRGRYLSSCLMYRGDVVGHEVNECVPSLKKRPSIQFVDWVPSVIKRGINFKAPIHSELNRVQRAVCMISNSTAIHEVFSRIHNRFDHMYNKRAFLHWYVGMEEKEFTEAREDLGMLESDYKEVCKESVDCEYDD
ncbi:hypothetical protein PCE1_004851 [Barthelona sp. PCE]